MLNIPEILIFRCTTEIVEKTFEGTVKGAAAGSKLGPIGTAVGAVAGTGSGLQEGFKAGSKVPTPTPPRQSTTKEKQEQARAVRQQLGARPGRGRAATIFNRGTGAGPTGLKTKTGQ